MDGVKRGIVNNPSVLLALDTGGKVFLQASGIVCKQADQIIAGSWQRYIGVWDGADLVLYLNRAEVARMPLRYVSGSEPGNTFFGMASEWLPCGYWKGGIGEVVILNYAATALDVATNPMFAKPYGAAAPPPMS
jgi:hypothetical protein